MADSKQLPGTLNITVVHGDPFRRTFTFTVNGELWVLPTEGWRGHIRASKAADAELLAQWNIDASNAGSGEVEGELPTTLPVGSYHYDIECDGVRTVLAGTITVLREVSRDDD